MNRQTLVNYTQDMIVANVVGLASILPYYALVGMDGENLWRVFVSFWTINWFTSLSIVWALRKFRTMHPYKEVQKSDSALQRNT